MCPSQNPVPSRFMASSGGDRIRVYWPFRLMAGKAAATEKYFGDEIRSPDYIRAFPQCAGAARRRSLCCNSGAGPRVASRSKHPAGLPRSPSPAPRLPRDQTAAMAHRATRRRTPPTQPWERIRIHPRADREKITALKADMMRAFVTGDLDTYWRLN